MTLWQSRFETAALWMAVALFAAFPMAIGLANLLMVLITLCVLIAGNHAQRWQTIRSSPVALAALALYCLICVGVLYTSAPQADVLLHLKKYAKLLFVPVLVSLLTASVWQRRCLSAFAAAMLFILACTWANVWVDLPWSNSQNQGWGVTHHVFGDYITQNVMMAFFVLLCLVQARQWQLKGSRLAVLGYGVALLAAVSITHLSMGRTGYIVLAAVLLAFVGMVLRGRALLTGIAVCAAALALTLWASDVMRARFVQGWEEAQRHEVDKVSSIGHRLNNYKTTTQLIAEKPVLGSGTGAYHTAICPFIEAPAQCDFFAWHPHNQFLFFAADHGLVGLALYLGLIVAVATAGWRSPDPLFKVITVGFAVLLAVDSMVNSPLWSSRESHLFAYFLGLLGTIRTKI